MYSLRFTVPCSGTDVLPRFSCGYHCLWHHERGIFFNNLSSCWIYEMFWLIIQGWNKWMGSKPQLAVVKVKCLVILSVWEVLKLVTSSLFLPNSEYVNLPMNKKHILRHFLDVIAGWKISAGSSSCVLCQSWHFCPPPPPPTTPTHLIKQIRCDGCALEPSRILGTRLCLPKQDSFYFYSFLFIGEAKWTFALHVCTLLWHLIEWTPGRLQYNDTAENNKRVIVDSPCLPPLWFTSGQMFSHLYHQESFQTLKNWVRELRQHGPPNIVVAIAGNKCDLSDARWTLNSKKQRQSISAQSADGDCGRMTRCMYCTRSTCFKETIVSNTRQLPVPGNENVHVNGISGDQRGCRLQRYELNVPLVFTGRCQRRMPRTTPTPSMPSS